jgi:hypothetical protein
MFIPTVFFSYTAIYRVMHFTYLIDARNNTYNMASNDKGVVYNNYLDKLEQAGEEMTYPAIPSRIIQSNFLELYVPYRKRHDRFINDGSSFSDIVCVKINDSIVDGIDWFNYYEKENYQIGIYAMIDITALKNGHYTVHIGFKNDKINCETIPFWKDVN